MSSSSPIRANGGRSQRPKATTVFTAAFLAGAAAAVGLNRTLDVHLAQRQPRVESEPIFVALRSLPQGAPLTVWDVALRDWPKAMLPAAAMRSSDSLEGMVVKHPLREGQPILNVQLVKAAVSNREQVADVVPAATAPVVPANVSQQGDLWSPAEPPAPSAPTADAVSQAPPTVAAEAAPVGIALANPPGPETPGEQQPVDAAKAVEPIVAEPLVVAGPANPDIDPVPLGSNAANDAVVTQARPASTRYLVVPERIALEVDRSFLPTTEPDTAVPETPTRAAPGRQATDAVQPVQTPPQTARVSTPRDRQPQRPPRSAAGQSAAPAKQPQKTSLLRGMLPGLPFGMGGVTPRQSQAEPDESVAPSTRPAAKPGLGFFR